MQVGSNTVVTINYTLKDDGGQVLDTSEGRGPLAYLHGAGNLIPGLEKELDGKNPGDKLNVTVAPEHAYGQHDPRAVHQVPKAAFQGVPDVQVGMQFRTEGQQGQRVVTVTKVEGDTITVDGNHALAGKTLHFDVEVVNVRQASPEEIAHGHVHGPGGHQH